MRAEIKLTDVKDIRDLHEYINAELRLRRVAPVSYTHLHIRTLRQKLGDAGALIETVRGVGYRLAQD